jgi:hypothetical protein
VEVLAILVAEGARKTEERGNCLTFTLLFLLGGLPFVNKDIINTWYVAIPIWFDDVLIY